MMRLCVIGNSHLAALQEGWSAVRDDFPDIKPTFFGAPVRYMHALARRGTKLVARHPKLGERYAMTSGGLTEIAGDYDAYMVYGLTLAPLTLKDLCLRHRTLDYAADARPLLSRRCHHEAVCAVLEESWSCKVLSMLVQITRAPILLLAAPMRSDEDPLHLMPLIESGDDRALNDSFLAGCRDVAIRRRARFLEQPADTLGKSPLTTQHHYSLAAAPGGAKRENDYIHMNGDYGTRLLRHVLPEVV
jgi:hypothetical protein